MAFAVVGEAADKEEDWLALERSWLGKLVGRGVVSCVIVAGGEVFMG